MYFSRGKQSFKFPDRFASGSLGNGVELTTLKELYRNTERRHTVNGYIPKKAERNDFFFVSQAFISFFQKKKTLFTLAPLRLQESQNSKEKNINL